MGNIYGSSFPLDAGGVIVTVHCPNEFAHKRLMQAINGIVPEAGEPLPVEDNTAPPHNDYGNPITPIYPEEPALRANPLGEDEE